MVLQAVRRRRVVSMDFHSCRNRTSAFHCSGNQHLLLYVLYMLSEVLQWLPHISLLSARVRQTAS